MTITPDTKDWTWVLERVCPECNYDVRSFPRERTSTLIRQSAARWQEVLAKPDARGRPSEDVWSPLEYGCHVRDVFDLYNDRLRRMLEEDNPQYENWDQDATAIEQRYGEQDPATVAKELGTAAAALAARFHTVDGGQWSRKGTRSDGAHFTIESFARYLIHDPYHHLYDVRVAT